jgi:ribonuclease J
VAGRVLVTTFSSHVARLQAGVEAAAASGREVAILGKSMREIAELGERYGYLSIPAGRAADPDRLADLSPNRLLLLCAGSQGEPHSALARLSRGDTADLGLDTGDVAIFSARTIPGRERAVSRVVDGLLRRGVRVLSDSSGPMVHVSGHAYRADLMRLVDAVAPRAVLPAHGERRALLACAEIAREAGVPADSVFVCDNGDSIFLGDSIRAVAQARPAGEIFLDAADGGEVSEDHLRARRALGAQGVVAISVGIRGGQWEIEVATRGVAALEKDVATAVAAEVSSALRQGRSGERIDPRGIRAEAELAAKRACRRELGIRPGVVVIVRG